MTGADTRLAADGEQGIRIQALPGADFDLAALHAYRPDRYPALLESAAMHARLGRYTILTAYPGEALRLEADGGLWRGDRRLAPESRFFQELDRDLSATRLAQNCPLPFCGGYLVYLAYEFLNQIEERVAIPPAQTALPVALMLPVAAGIIQDHGTASYYLVAGGAQAEQLLREMAADIAALPDNAPSEHLPPVTLDEEPDERFLRGVARIKTYIRDGDVFQVNLSRAWRAVFRDGFDPLALYSRLRRHNPAPFAGFLNWRGSYVLSSSPERLLHWDGRVLASRPIAGTRPRRGGPDDPMPGELIRHPKERAEHIMLIDLIRNDLGRVCAPGSIDVDELMAIESYAHVHHIVSNVRGRPHAGVTPGRMIAALFPGGTITGCPKVRCMEIIAELEAAPRGPYTGSMGYISNDGKMDLNILIRSMQCIGNEVHFRAGAGIVADSDPRHELAETRAKAKGLLRALGADGE